MALTISWDEYNGTPVYASPSVADVVHTHWGSADIAEMDPNANRILTATNSFNKQQAVRFSGFASESVDNFTLWCEDLVGDGIIVDRAGDDTGHRLYFKDSGAKTTSAPSASAFGSGVLVPYLEPGSPNIVGGPVTTNGDGSNIFLTQIRCGAAVMESYGLLLSLGFSVS